MSVAELDVVIKTGANGAIRGAARTVRKIAREADRINGKI